MPKMKAYKWKPCWCSWFDSGE